MIKSFYVVINNDASSIQNHAKSIQFQKNAMMIWAKHFFSTE